MAADACFFREGLEDLEGEFFFKACLDVEYRTLFQMFGVQEQFRGPSDISGVYQRQCSAARLAASKFASPALPTPHPVL